MDVELWLTSLSFSEISNAPNSDPGFHSEVSDESNDSNKESISSFTSAQTLGESSCSVSSDKHSHVSPITPGKCHLLDLPTELRLKIWLCIHNDILLQPDGKWFSKPTNAWDGLQLTCRGIHQEIFEYWPRLIVPTRRNDAFVTQKFSISLFKNFCRLSIELDFNKPAHFYKDFGSALSGLAPVLQDLRLFFIGQDRCGNSVSATGCAYSELAEEYVSKKLVPEGQFHQERQRAFSALFQLTSLKALVIKNANYPLLQSMILKHKPFLTHLHISTDPRSCLHQDHRVGTELVLISPPMHDLPPLKVLHISANAALTSAQVATKVSSTLEELHYVVPDTSFQILQWPWLRETAVFLRHLGQRGHNIRVLRLCLEAPISEDHGDYATFIGGLTNSLNSMRNLEILELHLNSLSPYFGDEIIKSIPPSLTRLYISDTLITAEKLAYAITRRYLKGYCQVGWFYTGPETPLARRKSRIHYSHSEPFDLAKEARNHWHGHGQVGGEADANRTDFIPFTLTGKLGFIGFKRQLNPTAKLTIMRLNGALLDRERNSHLALYCGGNLVPPNTIAHAPSTRSASRVRFRFVTSESLGWGKWPKNDVRAGLASRVASDPADDEVCLEWGEWPKRDTPADLVEFEKDDDYFGMEEAAEQMFHQELHVLAGGRPEWYWPEELNKGHWAIE